MPSPAESRAGTSIHFTQPVIERDDIRRLARDTRLPRQVRLRMLRLLALTHCTNPGEFVFGRLRVQEDLDDARRTWARFRSDSSLLDLVFARPEALPLWPSAPAREMPTRIARFESALFRNPRIAQCAMAFEQ